MNPFDKNRDDSGGRSPRNHALEAAPSSVLDWPLGTLSYIDGMGVKAFVALCARRLILAPCGDFASNVITLSIWANPVGLTMFSASAEETNDQRKHQENRKRPVKKTAAAKQGKTPARTRTAVK